MALLLPLGGCSDKAAPTISGNQAEQRRARLGSSDGRLAQTDTLGAEWLEKARLLDGPREPSGVAPVPQLGGAFVVDDEPRFGGSGGLYFLRRQGERLVSLPVRLPEGARWFGDDWEGATVARDRVVLIGSHARRQAKRAQLCYFPLSKVVVAAREVRIKVPPTCTGGHAQRRRIEQALRRAERRHGLTFPTDFAHRKPKRGGLNVESIAYHATTDRYYVGLRSPLAEWKGRSHAVLLQMRWRSETVKFDFAGLVDLEGRGIRGLTPEGAGLLLLAGSVGKRGRFDLYRLPRLPLVIPGPGPVTAIRLTPDGFPRHDPRVSPEGIGRLGNRLIIVSDSGAWTHRSAHYYLLPWKRP